MGSAGRFDKRPGVRDHVPRNGPQSLKALKQAVNNATLRCSARAAESPRLTVRRIVKEGL